MWTFVQTQRLLIAGMLVLAGLAFARAGSGGPAPSPVGRSLVIAPGEKAGDLPKVSDQAWVRDPLDVFVLARLDREHLKPEAETTREAWLRRASFDLTGLPPTPAEIDEFLTDRRTDAYETQVDRLLKSQRYGERGKEWLDLARYADTSGYQSDTPREIWNRVDDGAAL